MEKKLIASNNTQLNQDEIVTLLARRASSNKRMILTGIALLVLETIVILSWDKDMSWLYILLTCLIGVGFTGCILLMVFKKALIKISNPNLANGVTYKYSFYDDVFKLETLLGDKKGYSVMKYNDLEKIVVTNDYIYFYVNKVSIFFASVDKMHGNTNQMKEIFAKYSVKKNKRAE